ncbi:hypothetical protein Trihar35433_2042 [Trichoderma harzianum]|nr:hypothetical protein Trihar35433_2042 [Trichoderma harzianum]
MDPVNAVGIAAAVVQFADFGFRLVKNAHGLYKSPSGQAPEYINLSEVSEDLLRLADAIGAKINNIQGPAGDVFLRLRDKCKSTNDELQSILNRLKVQGTTKIELAADGLRVAFRQVAAAGEIERLANLLNQIRQEMNMAMIDEAGKAGVELRRFARQQADIIATLDRIDSASKQFSSSMIGFIDQWPDETVRYVLSDKWDGRKYAGRTVLREVQDDEHLEKVRQSLYFELISHREANIPKRHRVTFEWIFCEPRTSEDGHTLWSDFPLWLRGNSPDIYWITGKPGAGKSTLVKFISQNSKLETLLGEWATGSQLLIARFFSWTPGANRLQKSQEGLFRTLLFDVIRQQPRLAIDIFPARWFLLQSFNGSIKLPDLEIDELRLGFQNLLSATGNKLKLALLIDGLDEFDESHGEDHRDLVLLLREANVKDSVKICASSRPWNIFRDEYGHNPMLQLENLTRDDIKLFVEDSLLLSPGYSNFAATSPEAASRITADIVDKSRGVFLWVSVVSGLLGATLQEGARISDLQAIIDDLPKEVDNLFKYVWNRTSPRFRVEASQYFQLMRLYQQHEMNMFAVALWFGDTEIPVDLKAADVTSEYLIGVIKTLERKLVSRTGGLLELVSNGDRAEPLDESLGNVTVEYMHRTANDWANDNWASIISATDPSFDPFFWFSKGQALSVVLLKTPNSGLQNWPRLWCIASLIPENHPDKGILVAALDRLNRHLITLTREGRFGDKSNSYWVNQVISSSVSDKKLRVISPKVKQQVGTWTPNCTDFLELSALVPIPAYLKHKAQEDPNLFSSAESYNSSLLHRVIFSECWFSNTEPRLKFLDSLIEGKYRPPLEFLRKAKGEVKRATRVARIAHSPEHPLFNYLTQAKRILACRIWSPSMLFASWLEENRYLCRRR